MFASAVFLLWSVCACDALLNSQLRVTDTSERRRICYTRCNCLSTYARIYVHSTCLNPHCPLPGKCSSCCCMSAVLCAVFSRLHFPVAEWAGQKDRQDRQSRSLPAAIVSSEIHGSEQFAVRSAASQPAFRNDCSTKKKHPLASVLIL